MKKAGVAVVGAALAAAGLVGLTVGVFGRTSPSGMGVGEPRLTPAVTSMTAHLIYDADGTLSADILNDGFDLWNVVIGEGSATSPSHSVLLRVGLEGEPRSFWREAELYLTATEVGGSRLLQQSVASGYLGPDGAGEALFVVHNTGCRPLQIEAVLVAPDSTEVATVATIPFECGE